MHQLFIWTSVRAVRIISHQSFVCWGYKLLEKIPLYEVNELRRPLEGVFYSKGGIIVPVDTLLISSLEIFGVQPKRYWPIEDRAVDESGSLISALVVNYISSISTSSFWSNCISRHASSSLLKKDGLKLETGQLMKWQAGANFNSSDFFWGDEEMLLSQFGS